MTIPIPSSELSNLRHFALISPIVIPGVSSIKIFVSESLLIASLILFQSLFCKFPLISLFNSICPTEAIILLANCSAPISILNIATPFLLDCAILIAKLRANAVFPIAGRAAIIISSLACKPLVILSKS